MNKKPSKRYKQAYASDRAYYQGFYKKYPAVAKKHSSYKRSDMNAAAFDVLHPPSKKNIRSKADAEKK